MKTSKPALSEAPQQRPPSPYHGPGPLDAAQVQWDDILASIDEKDMPDFVDKLLQMKPYKAPEKGSLSS